MTDKDRPRRKAQVIYFSHGGGPLPLLGEASHQAMVAFMRRLPSRLRKPDAILVISAHWEECTLLSPTGGTFIAAARLCRNGGSAGQHDF